MRSAASALLFIAALSIPHVHAQTLAPFPASSECPVQMELRPDLNRGGIILSSAKPVSRVLLLSLHSKDGKAIATADVTLHGRTLTNGLLPTAATNSEITRTFHLAGAPGTSLSLQSEITIPKEMSVVDNLSIEQLGYRSGPDWHVTENAFCIARPETFLRIASIAKPDGTTASPNAKAAGATHR